MAIVTNTTLKNYFNAGDEPTEGNFADLIDSTGRTLQYVTSTGNQDFSSVVGDQRIMINVALANTNYIRLPEATTANGGVHVQVVFGIAIADVAHVGFKTSVIQGGAVATGDTNEAAAGAADHATAIADAGDVFHRVSFDLDTVALAGGTGGTVLDFWYPGVANVVLYRGHLISEIDAPTLANHFSTDEVDA
jgi:hypothetical protein